MNREEIEKEKKRKKINKEIDRLKTQLNELQEFRNCINYIDIQLM